jgi:hypothetical protein
VPEEATDPASCGMVVGAGAPMSPQGGVETGGGPAADVDGGLVAAGGTLVVVALALLTVVLVRGRRLRQGRT